MIKYPYIGILNICLFIRMYMLLMADKFCEGNDLLRSEISFMLTMKTIHNAGKMQI